MFGIDKIIKKYKKKYKKKKGILAFYKRVRKLYKNIELCSNAGLDIIDHYPKVSKYIIKLNGYSEFTYYTAYDEFEVALDCRNDFNGWFKFSLKPTTFEINPYSTQITLQIAISVLEKIETDIAPYVEQAKKIISEKESKFRVQQHFFKQQEDEIVNVRFN